MLFKNKYNVPVVTAVQMKLQPDHEVLPAVLKNISTVLVRVVIVGG